MNDLIARLENAAEVHDVCHKGRLVRWRSFGRGSPLVLLHGGHGSWLHWIHNIFPLSDSYRVLVPDLPGYNDSELADTDVGDDLGQRALVDAVRASLGDVIGAGTRFDLAGFSFGGLVAASLAVETGLVRRLCLLGVAGHGMARRPSQALKEWRTLSDPRASAAALRWNLGAFMLHTLRPQDELAPFIYEQSCRRTRFRSKPISRSGGLMRLAGLLDCPVLAIWGEHDVTAHPGQVGEALRQHRPERDWCLISDAGHWVQYEQPDAVNRLLLSWFKGAPHHTIPAA